MIKALHITLAYLTVTTFVMRVVWSFVDVDQLQQRWVKVTPHLIDTGLFVCGIALAYELYQQHGLPVWLAAKLTALLFYILLGVMTLRGRGLLKRWALAGALLSVSYIFWLAFSRQLVPW